MTHQKLNGVVTAMVTPLKGQDTLDRAGLERLIEHLISGGIHGLFILGTTGEAPSLPLRLREQLIEASCRQVAGRVPVIVGITGPCFTESVELAFKASEYGAQGVVAAPPYYFSLSQDDLLRYWEQLACAVPLPLFLYNSPSNTHHIIEVSTVLKAANIENIAGLKDSGCDMAYFHVLREELQSRPDFTLLVGPDELFAEGVLLGADGGMCAGSNVHPRLYVSLYEAAAAGDVKRTAELHRKVIELGLAVYRCAEHNANPLRGLKCALSELGICTDTVAPPLQRYSSREKASVARYIHSLDTVLVS